MAATPSIKITKSFQYRGVTRLFSNRYHFVGGTPADSAHWTTLADAIVTAEKAIYAPRVTIVQADGYGAGSDVPLFTKTYSTVGTWTTSGQQAPGDAAALIRYATTARTPKNHPVYLFNYYHAPFLQGGTSPDSIEATQVTAMQTYAGIWTGAGFSDGSTSYNRAGPNGATAVGYLVEPLCTHRDLPR